MSTKPTESSAFRVVVVGAGIAGLTASHCLQKAGIDHIVLERRLEIDPPEGAGIAIYPHGARFLQQIGRLDAAKAECNPCSHFKSLWPDGKLLIDIPYFDNIKNNNDGQDVLVFERRRYLRLLYDWLPDKSRIRMGTAVKDVKQTAHGVEVLLSDGSSEKGDLVLGCDGAYSRIRSLMWDHADTISPGRISSGDRTVMKTKWRCLVGVGPPELSLGRSDMVATHNQRFSFLTLTQPDFTCWLAVFRLDKPLTWPQRATYTAREAEELAASIADCPVSDSLVFGQLWDKRDRGTLIPVEEGVLKHWFSGRIVLAGDSAHKITPNIGLGGNLATESIMVLCNHISRMMEEQKGTKPSQLTLERHLGAYQKDQRNRAWRIMKFAGLISSIQAWDTPFTKFLATWVLPSLPDCSIALALGLIIKTAPTLEVGKTTSRVDTKQYMIKPVIKSYFGTAHAFKTLGMFVAILLPFYLCGYLDIHM